MKSGQGGHSDTAGMDGYLGFYLDSEIRDKKIHGLILLFV